MNHVKAHHLNKSNSNKEKGVCKCRCNIHLLMWCVCVCADRQRPWLLRQMEIDTHFLWRLNVLDYSLLLAHQPLHHDERHQSLSLATLIMRTKKSVSLRCFLHTSLQGFSTFCDPAFVVCQYTVLVSPSCHR